MSRNSILDSQRALSMVNRPIRVSATERHNTDIQEALESIDKLQRSYSEISTFYNSIASLENADYTPVISSTASIIINNALNSTGIKASDSFAMEAMSYNMSNIISNVKNTALAIWKKICDWFKTLIARVNNYLIDYRNGFELMGKKAIDTGNAILRGDLKQETHDIVSTSLNYDIGLLVSKDVTWDFLNLSKDYDDLVTDPMVGALGILNNLIEGLEQYGYKSNTYERELLKALKIMFKLFNQAPPPGVAHAKVPSGAMLTKNIYAGARLYATKLSEVEKLTMLGVHVEYNGDIEMVVEVSPVDQSVQPINARDMLRIGAMLNGKNNPWVENKKGGRHLEFADKLLKTLNGVTNKFPDEKSIDLAKRILLAYSSCIIKYNAAMYQVYKHAALSVSAIIDASAKKL